MQKKDWYYEDKKEGRLIGPMTRDELVAAHRNGTIDDHTRVLNQEFSQDLIDSPAVPYSRLASFDINFTPTVEEFYNTRTGHLSTVLSGPNNCGKTLLLKQLFSLIGQGGYMIACNRFSQVGVLNTRQLDKSQHHHYFKNFIQNFYTSKSNTEDNQLRLEEVITSLKDSQRDKLFKVCRDLLGNEFLLKRTDPDNSFSPFYVDMDGENLQYSSSGTRLLLTLLGILFDERFSVILLDEPELGLSPCIQAALSQFLFDNEQRQQFCPHIKQLYIATHSHLFLDRSVFSNNHIVTKAGNAISVKPVQSIGEFHHLQFNMLGNKLESIFLPSSIIIVEGDSDVTFITKVVQLHIPERKVAIVRAGGDGEVQNKLNVLREAFGDLMTSPFRDRLFVVLDKRNSLSTTRIENKGVPSGNITVWTKNGIEYYYPQDIVAAAYSCRVGELNRIDTENDPIEFNGIRKSKKELAQFVIDRLTTMHSMHPELQGLITRVRSACQ